MVEPAETVQEQHDVIDVYRAGLDLTLIDENLRLTVEERLRKWIRMARFAEELRRARERAGR